jgi:hypothetical protein
MGAVEELLTCTQNYDKPKPPTIKEFIVKERGKMSNCILCGELTNGSIGAAGIKWSCIFQPCKDKEDNALADRLGYESKVLNKFYEIVEKV